MSCILQITSAVTTNINTATTTEINIQAIDKGIHITLVVINTHHIN